MDISFFGKNVRNIEAVYIDGERIDMPYGGLKSDMNEYYFTKEALECLIEGLKYSNSNIKHLTPLSIYEHRDNE